MNLRPRQYKQDPYRLTDEAETNSLICHHKSREPYDGAKAPKTELVAGWIWRAGAIKNESRQRRALAGAFAKM